MKSFLLAPALALALLSPIAIAAADELPEAPDTMRVVDLKPGTVIELGRAIVIRKTARVESRSDERDLIHVEFWMKRTLPEDRLLPAGRRIELGERQPLKSIETVLFHAKNDVTLQDIALVDNAGLSRMTVADLKKILGKGTRVYLAPEVPEAALTDRSVKTFVQDVIRSAKRKLGGSKSPGAGAAH